MTVAGWGDHRATPAGLNAVTMIVGFAIFAAVRHTRVVVRNDLEGFFLLDPPRSTGRRKSFRMKDRKLRRKHCVAASDPMLSVT